MKLSNSGRSKCGWSKKRRIFLLYLHKNTSVEGVTSGGFIIIIIIIIIIISLFNNHMSDARAAYIIRASQIKHTQIESYID